MLLYNFRSLPFAVKGGGIRGKSSAYSTTPIANLYLFVLISCFHLKKCQTQPLFTAPIHFGTLSPPPPHSFSFSPLIAPRSSADFIPLLSRFLLFDITPFVPVVTGPSLPGGDRCSHSYSDVTQSISEGDKLSFKLLSVC